jgi:hypothetical protein
MDKIKKQFPCPYCSEKPFTTLQNLKRHITRKHSNISETIENDNVSVLSDNTIISINYQSDNDVPDISQPDPLPSREELIDIMNKYEKYQHLFPAIKKQMKWDEYNSKVDINLCKHTFSVNMYRILTDIKDLYAKPIDG